LANNKVSTLERLIQFIRSALAIETLSFQDRKNQLVADKHKIVILPREIIVHLVRKAEATRDNKAVGLERLRLVLT
jgi:hypothetical protein